MLRATIEIVPFGNEAAKRTIEILEIANIGYPFSSFEGWYADYAVTLWKDGERAWRYVKNWQRRLGARRLVQTALEAFE